MKNKSESLSWFFKESTSHEHDWKLLAPLLIKKNIDSYIHIYELHTYKDLFFPLIQICMHRRPSHLHSLPACRPFLLLVSWGGPLFSLGHLCLGVSVPQTHICFSLLSTSDVGFRISLPKCPGGAWHLLLYHRKYKQGPAWGFNVLILHPQCQHPMWAPSQVSQLHFRSSSQLVPWGSSRGWLRSLDPISRWETWMEL